MSDRQHVGAPQEFEFADQITDESFIEPGSPYKIVLLKAGQGSLIAAGNSKQPVGEDTFYVVQVADHLFNGPFLRSRLELCLCIGEGRARSVFLQFDRKARQECYHVGKLAGCNLCRKVHILRTWEQ